MNDLEKNQKLSEEQEINRQNQEALSNLKMRNNQERQDMKQFWQQQLAATKEMRQQAQDAEDVYKRQEIV